MKLTDPGLGSGTFPVYSRHFESCTSMYGPSNTLRTSEKAYWQMADALIFFLKYNPTPQRHVKRTAVSIDDLDLEKKTLKDLRRSCRQQDPLSDTVQIISDKSKVSKELSCLSEKTSSHNKS